MLALLSSAILAEAANIQTEKLGMWEGKAEGGFRASVVDIGGFDEKGNAEEHDYFECINKRDADGQKEGFGRSFGLVRLIRVPVDYFFIEKLNSISLQYLFDLSGVDLIKITQFLQSWINCSSLSNNE